jgi:hypothetical protein
VHEDQALWTKNISGAWAPRSVPATEKGKMARGGKRKYAANRASIPRDFPHTNTTPPSSHHPRPPPPLSKQPPHPKRTRREGLVEASESFSSLSARSSPRRPRWYINLSVQELYLFFNQFFILPVEKRYTSICSLYALDFRPLSERPSRFSC